jgi:hypothetical protein
MTKGHSITAFALLLLLPIAGLQAQDFTYTNTNGTITITGYTGPGGNVTIPGTIDGLPVTSLGDWAFTAVSNLSSVAIPDTVTNVGDYTFLGCTNLVSVSFGNSVKTIGSFAFSGCGSLANVAIPDSVTEIKDGAAGRVPEGAFSYCPGLTNVTLGNSITNIGDYAFFYCTGVSSLNVPDSAVRMGNALVNCYNLTNLTIGRALADLYIGNLYTCTSLAQIIVNPANTTYSSRDGVLFNKPQTTLLIYPPGKGGNYTIAANVTNVDVGAFIFCTSLVGAYFQGNAPSVGSYSFAADNNTTVYYLPRTTGWTSTFGGRPAVLWNPQAQTIDGSFGVRQNRFGFNITGTPDIPLVVEATTNLAAQSWVPLQSSKLTNGLIYFSDSQWTNFLERAYRIRSP